MTISLKRKNRSFTHFKHILGVAAGDATSYGVSTGITDTVSTAAVGTQCTGFTTAEGAGIADNAATAGKGDFLFITNMQNGPGTAGTISGFNMICGGMYLLPRNYYRQKPIAKTRQTRVVLNIIVFRAKMC